MSAPSATRSTPDTLRESNGAVQPTHNSVRRSTETKASFKTTEFIAFLAAVVGVLVAGAVVDDATNGGFDAKQVWLYVTLLTIGYMVSRGLAKSGSPDRYTEDRS